MMEVVQKIGAALRTLQADAALVLWSALPNSEGLDTNCAEESPGMQLVQKICRNLVRMNRLLSGWLPEGCC